MQAFSPDRRKFLKLSAAVTGSCLVLGINWSCTSGDQTPEEIQSNSFSPNAWLKLETDGQITVIVAESEMGQGPYTSLPMILAEELEVAWNKIRVEHASLDRVYGYQSTGGSSSVRKGWTTLREAGAITRQLLINAGASLLSVPVVECKAKLGRVIHSTSGREIPYHELITAASNQSIPDRAYLKELDKFTIIGQSLPRIDIPDKVNGKALFGMDIKLPDMLYATITHCPVFGGQPKNVDDTQARKILGVKDILQIEEGIVVVADDTWTAFKAKDVLKIEWEYGDKKDLSTESIIEGLRISSTNVEEVAWEEGDTKTAFTQHETSIEAEYIQSFQAHAPLEPMNCTAHFKDDGQLEIWAPTQSPSAAHNVASAISQSKLERGVKKIQAKLFGSHDQSIDIHTTLLGGGFGRRLNQYYVAEVVKIARHYDKPVQLVWTREEDIQHDHYHPLTVHKLKGALDKNGIPVAWKHVIAGHGVSAGGVVPHPYNIANLHLSVHNHDVVIPKGAWRSVSPHYNVFAVEHFLDELAWAGKQDPVNLRLKLLNDIPRLRNVLEIVADISDWSNLSNGRIAHGVAIMHHWGSHVAQVVELSGSIKDGLKVKKVTCLIDCGIVINPDIVKQQIEGSIIFALSAAIKSKITLKDGRVEQSNYHNYQILSIQETPEIEVVIVKSSEAPGGIGEPGVPPLAPALANAVLAATGNPMRELPFKLS